MLLKGPFMLVGLELLPSLKTIVPLSSAAENYADICIVIEQLFEENVDRL